MKLYHIIFPLLVISSLLGCEKFLSETPRTSISDEQLFETQEGFQQALTGVYVALAGRSLYGDNLTMGYLSALAKNYNVSPTSHEFYPTTTFNYENSNYVNSIWSEAYSTIATLNNILGYIDAQSAVFSGNNFAQTKGEALAIRAFLHFDLLRLFAPNYRTNPTATAIPYRKNYTLAVEPALTSTEVIDLILTDLNEAEQLLQQDPVISTDLNRRFRLNYYAILALKARIYEYIDNEQEAVNYATRVVESARFPFVESDNIATINTGRKDRLFQSELVLALRSLEIETWTNSGTDVYFRFVTAGAENFSLTLPEANYIELFEANVYPTDYRYQYLFEIDASTNNITNIKYPSKYWQTWVITTDETSTDRLDQTIPLIRISEMYYILANHAASFEQALGYLNTVREHRGITIPLNAITINTESLLQNEITKEYEKEFYAEGQTFFWYKQLNSPTMRLFTGVVTAENYIFPIPPTELEFNPTY